MKTKKKVNKPEKVETSLKAGDTVMVIAGGHKEKRPNKGQVGKIREFIGKKNDRVIVEGVNMVKRHQRQTAPGKPSGIIEKEAGIHISNVMYYVEKLKKPVRIRQSYLEDGTKVRGYLDPESKKFVQLEQ